jgi:hypothetical protein
MCHCCWVNGSWHFKGLLATTQTATHFYIPQLITLLWKTKNLLIKKIWKELIILTCFHLSGQEVFLHKTFHSYTVRARQGGNQSSRDGRSGGSHPKSAGASLRRYNEAALIQVFDWRLQSSWQQSGFIFLRTWFQILTGVGCPEKFILVLFSPTRKNASTMLESRPWSIPLKSSPVHYLLM